MIEVKHFDDIELYIKGIEIERIGNKAIHEAITENRKNGIPNVFSCDGKIYYEVNGVITTESPFKNSESKKNNAN